MSEPWSQLGHYRLRLLDTMEFRYFMPGDLRLYVELGLREYPRRCNELRAKDYLFAAAAASELLPDMTLAQDCYLLLGFKELPPTTEVPREVVELLLEHAADPLERIRPESNIRLGFLINRAHDILVAA